MSATLYDEALLNKIKAWTNNTSIHVYGPDNDTERLFEVEADQKNDKPIQFPLIALRRSPGGFQITNLSKKPMSYDGVTLEATEEKSLTLNAIPIRLGYQLDIYTRNKIEAEEYARNFVFNIINYPKFNVIVPYMGKDFVHRATLHLSENVEDNSDIPQRLSMGQFTRYTLNLYVDDAYLWDIRERDNYKIETDVKTNDEDIVTCDC